MINEQNSKTKKYDLEERTFEFAKRVRQLIKKLPKNIGNIEDGKQVIRSSGSVGANYFEANGASSQKDFRNKISICKKEARETQYWLKIIMGADSTLKEEAEKLSKEVQELTLIFSKIILTIDRKKKT